jgi:hypothetical protein
MPTWPGESEGVDRRRTLLLGACLITLVSCEYTSSVVVKNQTRRPVSARLVNTSTGYEFSEIKLAPGERNAIWVARRREGECHLVKARIDVEDQQGEIIARYGPPICMGDVFVVSPSPSPTS